MLERGKLERGIVEIVDTESLVPKDHLLRKIDAAVDFNRLYEMVEPLYSEDNGRPNVDPVVLFKMVLIQHLYGLPSLRRTADEVSANICYRWFLGYTLQEETPHFSTVSYNFRHRFTEDTVNQIFWLDSGRSSGSRIYVPKGSIHGRHPYQGKCQYEEADGKPKKRFTHRSRSLLSPSFSSLTFSPYREKFSFLLQERAVTVMGRAQYVNTA